MGEQRVRGAAAGHVRRAFIEAVLRDLEALEAMIAGDLMETGVRRIGAEQEIFLVDRSWRPAPVATDVIARLADPHFTTELGRFNLELNLDPLVWGNDCLSTLEREIDARVGALRRAAAELGVDCVLTGILPTLRSSDLGLDNMTPRARYRALNTALRELSADGFGIHLRGADEISLRHDSVMLEACCTSFQLHYQVGPDEFPELYNLAQVIIAPVLAAAVNSPILFGRRLWKESRIPLFQQAIDSRGSTFHLRERPPRVRFGHRWVDASAVELFEQDIARFRVLVSTESTEDPFERLANGQAPRLTALRVFGGTVYRWNRACYGISDGKPHLRIEMRALPAGPSIADQVANAALFYGLMSALPDEIGDVRRRIGFEHARSNFSAAAQYGLDTQLCWFGDRPVAARELLAGELIPAARRGLQRAGIDAADSERYLGIVEDRVASGRTGAQWLLDSWRVLSDAGNSNDEIVTALTAATADRQANCGPAHTWETARLDEGISMRPTDLRVEEFMTTDLFSVDPEEPIALAARLMEWRHVRHMPVEDRGGKLVGLLSCFEVMRQFGEHPKHADRGSAPVRSVMDPEPVTVSPAASMTDAIHLLRTENVDCLPVVADGRLVGIVTEHDFIHIAARLLESS